MCIFIVHVVIPCSKMPYEIVKPPSNGWGMDTQLYALPTLPVLARGRFWLLELRVSRTFLDKLRPQLLRPWIPNSKRCQHFCPRSDRFWLLELRVS